MGSLFAWLKRRKNSAITDRNLTVHNAAEFTELAETTISLAKDIAAALHNRMGDYSRQITATANLLPDALILVNGTDYTIKSFNHAAENMFGVYADDIFGTVICDLFVDLNGNKLDLSTLIDTIGASKSYIHQRPWKHNTPDSLSVLRGVKKNGTVFGVDTALASFTSHDGALTHIITVRDISQYIRIQQDLALSELHYRTIFDMSFDGICIAQHGVIRENNTAWDRIFSLSEPCQGQPISKMFKEDCLDKIMYCVSAHENGDETRFNISATSIGGVSLVLGIAPVGVLNGGSASIMTVRQAGT